MEQNDNLRLKVTATMLGKLRDHFDIPLSFLTAATDHGDVLGNGMGHFVRWSENGQLMGFGNMFLSLLSFFYR